MLRPYLRLLRPWVTFLVMVGTAVAARLWSTGISTVLISIVAVSNGLLMAGAHVFNDSQDAVEDAVNRPDRPIPSGAVRADVASRVGLGLSALGAAVAFVASTHLGLASAAVALLSLAYTRWLKAVPLVGNLVCAALCIYPIGCWALLGSSLRSDYLTILGALLTFRLGAEILKTAEDAVGDRAAGLRTLATTRSVGFANRIGAVLQCVALLIGWTLAIDAGTPYLVTIVLSSLVALFACAVAFGARHPSAKLPIARSESAILALMTVGLIFGLPPG